MGIESRTTISNSRRNIAQEQGPDPHSRTLGEEEHSDHSHMVELGHIHKQVAGVGRHLAEDTVQLGEPENLAATRVVAHTYLGGWVGTLSVRTDFAADRNRILDEVKAVVMDAAMGD